MFCRYCGFKNENTPARCRFRDSLLETTAPEINQSVFIDLRPFGQPSSAQETAQHFSFALQGYTDTKVTTCTDTLKRSTQLFIL